MHTAMSEAGGSGSGSATEEHKDAAGQRGGRAGDGGQGREHGGDGPGGGRSSDVAVQPPLPAQLQQLSTTASIAAPAAAAPTQPASSSDAAKLRQLQSLMQQAREGYQALNARYSAVQAECRQLVRKEEDSAATIQRLTAQVHRLSAAAAVAVNQGAGMAGIGGHAAEEEEKSELGLGLGLGKDRRGSDVDIAVQLREQAMVDRMQQLQFELANQRKETDDWKHRCREAQQQAEAARQHQLEQQHLPQQASAQIDALRHQVEQLTLDTAAIDSLALDLSVNQKERERAERELRVLKDELQRLMAKLEDERDERDREQAVHQHKYLALRQKAEESESLASQNAHLSHELSLLAASVTALRDQLVATQRDNRTLREEADTARAERAEMEAKMRRYAADMEGGQLVDRRLVVKMLTTYYERGQAQDVLDLMFRLLQFTDEERRRVMASRRGRGWVGSVASMLNPFDSEQDSSVQQRDDASVADLWVEFLLKETAKEEQGSVATARPSKAIYEAMASPTAANGDTKPAAARFFTTPQPQRSIAATGTTAAPPSSSSSFLPSPSLVQSTYSASPTTTPLPLAPTQLAHTQSAPPAPFLPAPSLPHDPFRAPLPLKATPIKLPPHIRPAFPPPGRPLAAPPPAQPLPSHPLFAAGLPVPRAAVPGQPVPVARPASPAPTSELP